MKRFLARHSPLVILAGLCIILAVVSEDFRNPFNLQTVAYRTAVVGIMAIGECLVILTAGIDLSVGSVAALAGVIGGLAMKWLGTPGPDGAVIITNMDMCLGVMAGALMGLCCGAINGTLVTKGKMPPFIVTLGMMMMARGVAMLLSDAVPISGFPESFGYLGGAMEGFWYIPVVITIIITAVFVITLTYTRFGRSLYAIGGKLAAARLSGIPVDFVRLGAYSLCGLLAGFAGVMLVSKTSIASPSAAETYELSAIAACVIGGTSLMGGEGSALGALAGALIMNVLINFCNLRGIEVHWQMVFVGALIIVIICYDNYRKRRAGLLKEE